MNNGGQNTGHLMASGELKFFATPTENSTICFAHGDNGDNF